MRRKIIASALAAVLIAASQVTANADPTSSEPVPDAGGSAFRWYVSDIDGSYQPYGIYVPKSYNSTEQSGTVIVGLHGFGGSATSTFSAYLRTWADTNNTVLLSLQGRGNQNWDYVADQDLFDVLTDVSENYSVDADRLFVEGCSMGGHGAYRWALRYPDMFAAAAPQSGWTSYEDFYFKWYAGLAEDVGHWGYANGNQPPDLASAQYVDPSRKPLLETASTRYQLPNAKYTSIMMNSSSGDTVNYPQNAAWIRDGLQELGYTVTDYPWTGDAPQFAWRQVGGGHCASNTPTAVYPFFVGKERVTDPASPVYTTNTLKYNEAYWVRIDRLEYANQWATINPAVISPHRIDVSTTNVTQYSLSLDAALVDMGAPIEIYTDGIRSYSGPPSSSLTLFASRPLTGSIQSWSVIDTLPNTLRKTHTSDGPIGDAFRSAFTVAYGTAGSQAQTAQNLADAQQFVDEWNAVMIQDKAAWGFPEPQVYLNAIPDTAVTAKMIQSTNLRLFGDQSSNNIIGAVAQQLPVKLLNDGVKVGKRTYRGSNVRYTLIYPNPLNADKYVVLGKGYLSDSKIAGTTLGKNLEYLPWGQPDYVVWDASLVPGPTVQNPDGTILRNLLDTYLEAGFFDQNWTLDVTPPATTLFTQIVTGGVQVRLAGADNLGGFGISQTEYRLDGSPWTAYTGPLIVDEGVHRLEYRSADAAGRDTSPQGVVPNNIESSKTALIGPTTLGCDHTITGTSNGPLTVTGQMCVLGGTINGPVTVKSGASLAVVGGTIHGPLAATGASQILMCDTSVAGPVSIRKATGPIMLGKVNDSGCASNSVRGPITISGTHDAVTVGGTVVRGPLSLSGNSDGVTITDSTVTGPISVTRNSGGVLLTNNGVNGPVTVASNTGPFITVGGNTIRGPLSCSGNTPAPDDAGAANTVSGPTAGQCRAFG